MASLRIARMEMIACGVHQMREYLYMALMIIPWKAERLRDVSKVHNFLELVIL